VRESPDSASIEALEWQDKMQVQELGFVNQLSILNRRLSELVARQPSIRRECITANHAVTSAGIRHGYRRLQQLIRRPGGIYELWPLCVMIVGPFLPGAVAFGMAMAWSDSFAVAMEWFLYTAAIVAAFLACVLFVPNNVNLEARARQTSYQLRDAQAHAIELRLQLSKVERAIRADTEARDAIQTSVQYERERLLQENWKAMRSDEWESFLARAFRLLGGKVERTGKSGDQGVDLILEIGQRRYAIQAKGYLDAVGNSAVQEAVAGVAHYRCNCSAVITNSRFTRGAAELAESNCCRLIGEDDIPALVLGKLML
jgi:Restriction endonuclease